MTEGSTSAVPPMIKGLQRALLVATTALLLSMVVRFLKPCWFVELDWRYPVGLPVALAMLGLLLLYMRPDARLVALTQILLGLLPMTFTPVPSRVSCDPVSIQEIKDTGIHWFGAQAPKNIAECQFRVWGELGLTAAIPPPALYLRLLARRPDRTGEPRYFEGIADAKARGDRPVHDWSANVDICDVASRTEFEVRAIIPRTAPSPGAPLSDVLANPLYQSQSAHLRFAPTEELKFTVDGQPVVLAESPTVTAEIWHDGFADADCTIDWNDGSGPEPVSVPFRKRHRLRHTYSTAGMRHLKFRLFDKWTHETYEPVVDVIVPSAGH